MKSTKFYAKSRTISLLIGLVILTMILPGVVSASSVNTMPPKAQFTSNIVQGQSPLTVQFIDQSTGTAPMTYHWDFSDGAGNLPANSEQNPSWRFWAEDAPSFTVSLTVTNAYGTDTIVKNNYITLADTSSTSQTLTTDKISSFGGTWDTKIFGDWNGDGKTEVGVYNNGIWYLDYNGNGIYDSSVVDRTATFGQAGYKPVVGDWNGDGRTEIGTEKNGFWAIDYNGNYKWDGAVTDRYAALGQTGDIPVVGDWNGDGRTEIGSFKGGYWSVDYNGNYKWDGTVTDRYAALGQTGDIPVAGDWNGNGRTKIGVEKNGFWATDYNGNYKWDGAVTDRYAAFGQTGDIPVVGDWNGDAKETIGVYVKGVFYLKNSNTGGKADLTFAFGKQGDIPMAGDWNGDGKTELGVTRGTTWYFDTNGDRILRGSTSVTPAPSITVTSPNGGESWVRGNSYTIKWTSTGSVGSYVKIELLKAGTVVQTISSSTPNDGIFSDGWTVPTGFTTGTDYRIRVTSTTNPSITDTSNGNFAIGTTPSATTMTVPTAQFTSSVQTGTAPLTVQFTDQSTGTAPLTYAWDFNNDGSTDSTVKSPSFAYKTAGTYTVKLTVTNAHGTDTEIKTGYIKTASSAITSLPIAQFTSSFQTGTAPLTVQFTDQSTGTAPLTYAWDFNNDGSTDSTVKSPSFAYQTSGTYTVKLTVTNANGTDSEIKTGYISVSSIQSGSCYGAETCNPTGNPIGGGAGYTRIITETDSRVKYVVTTRDQLLTALKSAKAGEVVFVPSSATIDLTGASTVTIPAGVILASDRGYNGRAGGLIKRDNSGTIPLATFMAGGDNVRFTGLRIQGPHSGYGADYGDNVKCAIMEENKNGLEVDNCEIYYWSYAGVAFENTRNSAWSGNVHHNSIHHIAGEGYGYGVMVAYGDVLIEANNFDYTRHAVIGEGCPGEKFVYRYNYYGSHSLNPVLDLHTNCGGWSAGGVSGRLYDIHHNTIVYAGSVTLNAYGTPSEGLYITKNILATPVQALNGPTRIFMTDNRVAGKLVASGPVN